MKKLLRSGIALLLVLSIISIGNFPALANSLLGSGTENDPYLIHNGAELALMAQLVNTPTVPNPSTHNFNQYFRAHYKLVNSIDITAYGIQFNGGKGWIPIGANYFGGEFDGNGKNINGLYINDTSANNLGLFSTMYGGIVKNLTMTNAYILGGNNVGGVAGYIFQGDIENCTFSGSVNGLEYVGGITGVGARSVKNCSSSGSVNGHKYVGGISGGNYGAMENCHSSSTVSGIYGNNKEIGGLAGNNSGMIKDSNFSGTVSGGSDIGGLTGSNNSVVITSYSTGEVSGGHAVGGLVGYNAQNGLVERSYSTGTVSGNRAGGVVGYNEYGIVDRCYSLGTVIGHQIGGIAGKSDWGTITNSYSAGAIIGSWGDIGGIVGWNNGGSVTNCAALNPSVTDNNSSLHGRIAGFNNIVHSSVPSHLSNNTAFSEMTVTGDGIPKTLIKGHNQVDGTDITAATIKSDGTIGGRFTTAGGWTIQNGKLPSFGVPVDMPIHIANSSALPAPVKAVNVPGSNLPIGVWVNSSLTNSITPGRWHSGMGLSTMNPEFETAVMNFSPGTYYYLLAPSGRWSIDSSCRVIVVTVDAGGSVTASGRSISWSGSLDPIASDPVKVIWDGSAWAVSWG